MPKYMITGSYNADGAKGLLSEGGTGRRAAVEALVASVGGTLETMYYMFGNDDVIVIADVPSDEAAAAVALTVGASASVSIRTNVLLTPEQVDEAARQSPAYRPPGG